MDDFKKQKMLLTAGLMILAGQVLFAEYKFDFATDHPDGIYKTGEDIKFTVKLSDNGKPVTGKLICCTITGQKEPVWSDSDKVQTITVKAKQQGVYRVNASVYELDRKTKVNVKKPQWNLPLGAGAMVDPYLIRQAVPEPADFDEFWANNRKELAKVPMKPVLTLKEKKAGFVYYYVSIPCAGRMPVEGCLSIPEKASPKSCIAQVGFMGAGGTKAAFTQKPGMISLNLNAHGFKNDQNADYYKEYYKGPGKSYMHQNWDDRNKCFFRDQFMRVLRALEYVKSLPEWDGKNLIVHGTSMGGGQALAAAGLDPAVTLCIAQDPALTGHLGHLQKPAQPDGWPFIFGVTPKDRYDIVTKNCGYFDGVNFAKRIKGRLCMSSGFMDTTCNSPMVFCAYNEAKCEKSMENTIRGAHCYTKATQGWKLIDELSGKRK